MVRVGQNVQPYIRLQMRKKNSSGKQTNKKIKNANQLSKHLEFPLIHRSPVLCYHSILLDSRWKKFNTMPLQLEPPMSWILDNASHFLS